MSKPIDAPRAWGLSEGGFLLEFACRHKPEDDRVEKVRIIRDRDFRRIMRENRELKKRVAAFEINCQRYQEMLKASREKTNKPNHD